MKKGRKGRKKNKKWIYIPVVVILFLAACMNGPTASDETDEAVQTEALTDTQTNMYAETDSLTDTKKSAETDRISDEETADNAGSDNEQTEESLMEVHFIDVGQGDSTLIKCDGHYMLIDAGDDSKGTAIQNYLIKQGVEKLDYLILTHPDADHIGGAPVIITKFDIAQVFMSNYEKDNKTYLKVIQALDDKALSWSTPSVGSTYGLGSALMTVLAPNGLYENPNDASIAVKIEKGKNQFLFTGDAQEQAETDMLDNGLDLMADVYHVGHHGSKTSSSQAFLNAVSPVYAVISCAEGNSYGHPDAEPLNHLRAMGVQVFRTDEQGSIVATSDGAKITWNCAPSETWQAGENTQNAGEITQNAAENTNAAKMVNDIETTDNSKASDSDNQETQNDQDTITASSEEQTISSQTEGDVIVHITKTGKKYHSAGCRYLSQSDIETTLSDAIAKGLGPCSVCNPPQ